ncbi:MAG: MBL fold metallo-hydrolase [Candidatus Berkelbacteria bacterium]|nr:MBL fold metallo-hydrolase [Candidatus Berkelbacteria bacterium]
MVRKKRIAFSLLGSLAIIAFLVWLSLIYTRGAEQKLTVNFFDVGQGDAILIQAPKGEVLIDGGPGKQVLEKLGETLPFTDHKIELIILTHPDADHINGLVEILRNYRVDEVMETGVTNDNKAYAEWRKLIDDKKIKDTIAKKGDKVDLGEGIELNFMWPEENLKDQKIENTNNTSIINFLDWGNIDVVLTGDAETPVLDRIADENPGIKIEILKQPHHGSKNGISQKFLETFRPDISVISVGAKNRYGHPDQDTLDILGKLGIKVYRTDERGTIKAIIDKDSYKIETQR